MEVREADKKDLKKIVDLMARANDEFGHASVPFSDIVTHNTIQRVLNHQNHAAFVLEDGKELRGVIVGLNNQLWYSKKRQISDLFFYVDKDSRGYGARLLSTFLGWARKVPNVVEISLSVTSGMKEFKRVERLFEVSGFSKVGGVYTLHPEEGDETWAA